MKMKLLFTLCLLLLIMSCQTPTARTGYTAIHSGVAWFDQHNNEVNAHGACIVKEANVYYLFGEYKSDSINAFKGGILGPNRVGERPKVMKCPSTGEFVMYMHCDDMKYNDPHVG